jgi:hypothetical protein
MSIRRHITRRKVIEVAKYLSSLATIFICRFFGGRRL